MAEKDKRYYWLKLKRDFFKRHDIQIIESMPNGKDYILFYLKLLCESVDHDGTLRFSEQIPYNEQMLSTITNTNVDIVRSAIKIFSELHMMEVMDDGTFYMNEVCKMLGSETYWAMKKREKRELSVGQFPTVSNESPTCPSKSIEIDLELNKEKEIKRTDYQQIADLYNEICISFPRLKSLSDSRKKAIKARLNTYSVDDFKSLFEKAEASDFLKGKNDRNWSATFDWLIKDSNMAKVLEGQYENKPKQATGRKEVVPAWMSKPNKFHNYQQRNEDYDSLIDQNDPLMRREEPKTAGNNEEVRAKADALRRAIAGE